MQYFNFIFNSRPEHTEPEVYTGPELPKDIYEYITNFTDDKTTLSMLSVNRKYNQDEFFHRVLLKKYPLLIKFKTGSFKELFLDMAQSMYHLKRKYQIPYIPVDTYDPWDHYHSFSTETYKVALDYASLTNDLDLIKFLFQKVGREFHHFTTLKNIGKVGNIDIINYILSLNVYGYDYLLEGACSGGNIDIVRFLCSKNVTFFDISMIQAAKGGHINVIKLLIEKGATNFDDVLEEAAIYGYLDIVKLMLENGATSVTVAFNNAGLNGRTEIVNYLLYNTEPKITFSLKRDRDSDIIDMIIKKGTIYFD